MGLFSDLESSLKSAAMAGLSAEAPQLLSKVLAQTNFGSLQGLVDQLRAGGLDQQVNSWLGNGTNLPVSAEQLRAALGNEQVQELAAKFGIPVDKVLNLLSEHLPETVDKASPNGVVQEPSATPPSS